MKLPIKDKYFKLIKEGKKRFEFRDAHITFINETTKEELKRDIKDVAIYDAKHVFRFCPELEQEMFDDKQILVFTLNKVLK